MITYNNKLHTIMCYIEHNIACYSFLIGICF